MADPNSLVSWLSSLFSGADSAAGAAGAAGGAAGVTAAIRQARYEAKTAQRLVTLETDVAGLKRKDEKHDRQFAQLRGDLRVLDARSIEAVHDRKEMLALLKGETYDRPAPEPMTFPEERTEV